MKHRRHVLIGGVSGGARYALAFMLATVLISTISVVGRSLVIKGDAHLSYDNVAETTAAAIVLDANPEEQRAVIEAISQLEYEFEPGAVVIRVVDNDSLATAGSYLPAEGVIHVQRSYVRETENPLSRVLAHEIGHLVDDWLLGSSDRARFRELRNHPEALGWYAMEQEWEDRPAEDFAEVFAVYADPATSVSVMTSYGQSTNASDLRQLMASVLPEGIVTQPKTSVTDVLALALESLAEDAKQRPTGVWFGLLGTGYVVTGIRWGSKDARDGVRRVSR